MLTRAMLYDLFLPPDTRSTDDHSLDLEVLPPWMKDGGRIMIEKDGTYHRAFLTFVAPGYWYASVRRRNGVELWSKQLLFLMKDHRDYISSGKILPGWLNTSSVTFLRLLGRANFVFAATILDCSPGSLARALSPSNPDYSIWYEAYVEEFNKLIALECFELISITE